MRLGALVLALLASAPAGARSLSGLLNDVVARDNLGRVTPSIAAIPVLTKIAIRSADFPTASTTPDLLYRYDPGTGAFVRMSTAHGSVFLEQADTVGAHVVELGSTAFVSDAEELDGHDVAGVISRFSTVFPPAHYVLRFDEFHIRTAGVSFGITYGLTENLDVNLVVPTLATTLEVTGSQRATLAGLPGVTFALSRIAIDETRLGVGDILCRAKYRLPLDWFADVAATLSLRIPSGKATDFQGLGDWVVTPLVVASRYVGPHNGHLQVGVDVDASAIERSRVRYGVGAALQAAEWLSFLLDVFGSSGVSDERISAGSFFVRRFPGSTAATEVRISTTSPRTDIVDVSAGFKLSFGASLTGFAGAIVPVTHDGLRAEVIPICGIEWTFF